MPFFRITNSTIGKKCPKGIIVIVENGALLALGGILQ